MGGREGEREGGREWREGGRESKQWRMIYKCSDANYELL